VRARIYHRARDAVDGFVETRSPRLVEDYRRSLEQAIGEVERSFNGLVETTLTALQPLSSADARASEPTSIAALPEGQERLGSTGTAKADEVIERDNIEPADNDKRLLNTVGQTHCYQLEWSASSGCSICHKWAVCIDSAYCWNRD
jgi:hypothetical protein